MKKPQERKSSGQECSHAVRGVTSYGDICLDCGKKRYDTPQPKDTNPNGSIHTEKDRYQPTGWEQDWRQYFIYMVNKAKENDPFWSSTERLVENAMERLRDRYSQAIQKAVDEERKKLTKIRLVPVKVFGAEDGYGLMDAVSAWSDCNRAVDHIYRVDDIEEEYRHKGDTITIYVDKEALTQLTNSPQHP